MGKQYIFVTLVRAGRTVSSVRRASGRVESLSREVRRLPDEVMVEPRWEALVGERPGRGTPKVSPLAEAWSCQGSAVTTG